MNPKAPRKPHGAVEGLLLCLQRVRLPKEAQEGALLQASAVIRRTGLQSQLKPHTCVLEYVNLEKENLMTTYTHNDLMNTLNSILGSVEITPKNVQIFGTGFRLVFDLKNVTAIVNIYDDQYAEYWTDLQSLSSDGLYKKFNSDEELIKTINSWLNGLSKI